MTGLTDVTGWVLDVDGCLVRTNRAGGAGGTLIPGAADFVTGLQAAGHRVLVCTNASEQPPATYAAHLRDLGIPVADEDLVTAGSAGADHLAAHHPGARVLAVGGEGISTPLLERGLVLADASDAAEVEAVLVGASPTYSHADLNAACLAVESGAILYVSQDQPWFHGGRGRSVAISAVIAAAITWVTHVEPVVTGKPSAVLAESLLARLERDPGQVAVVGDARAEIQLARHMGARSVAVLSGALTTDAIAALAPPLHPDHVVDDVAALHQLLTSSTTRPSGVTS